jgi:hypothetical protein
MMNHINVQVFSSSADFLEFKAVSL